MLLDRVVEGYLLKRNSIFWRNIGMMQTSSIMAHCGWEVSQRFVWLAQATY